LHRLVYAVAVLAVLHFFWMRAGKSNFAEVFVYAAVLFVLLTWRVVHSSVWLRLLRSMRFSR
jgi:sulfoxide reductase heme-binding subunit YedZ